MALQTWWLYVTAVFLISATPGPNMLHVMVQSIHHGPRRALFSMVGLMTANMLCLIASAAGLGALLKASPGLYDVLRYAGVAYLVWLGIKAWRAPVGGGDSGDAGSGRTATALYWTGLGTGLSNPKLIIFAAALLPQFVDLNRPFVPQLAILVLSFAVIEAFWFGVYALGGRSLARWLAPTSRQRLFNRATALLFIGFGGALLGSRV
ncbi:threonine/homoserine/homoserine lactone efflux protein [Sphingomonas naasensis]|uniref:LysE family translocator n=1 Tax=Sphingomonas naasensis TaxID=1344951 RepID=A0A4V3QW80_9SPHN|nr:LysE family translocator [Sphingomonas naasensis]NIJ21516.1 threonine/homoserine/homoserine lactone efflux protein [Sphingomonas naasensis]TGX41532.1 LysE family translocator [Sphingomonas naasensis]